MNFALKTLKIFDVTLEGERGHLRHGDNSEQSYVWDYEWMKDMFYKVIESWQIYLKGRNEHVENLDATLVNGYQITGVKYKTQLTSYLPSLLNHYHPWINFKLFFKVSKCHWGYDFIWHSNYIHSQIKTISCPLCSMVSTYSHFFGL